MSHGLMYSILQGRHAAYPMLNGAAALQLTWSCGDICQAECLHTAQAVLHSAAIFRMDPCQHFQLETLQGTDFCVYRRTWRRPRL